MCMFFGLLQASDTARVRIKPFKALKNSTIIKNQNAKNIVKKNLLQK